MKTAYNYILFIKCSLEGTKKFRIITSLIFSILLPIAITATSNGDYSLLEIGIEMIISFVVIFIFMTIVTILLIIGEDLIDKSQIFAIIVLVTYVIFGSFVLISILDQIVLNFFTLEDSDEKTEYISLIVQVVGIVFASTVPIILTKRTLLSNEEQHSRDRVLSVRPLIRYTADPLNIRCFRELSITNDYHRFLSSSLSCVLVMSNKISNISKNLSFDVVSVRINNKNIDYAKFFFVEQYEGIISLYKDEAIAICIESPKELDMNECKEVVSKFEITLRVEVSDILTTRYYQDIKVKISPNVENAIYELTELIEISND